MKNKGFSLIELVVAMGIGSIVLLMVSVMLVRGTGIFREENDEVNTRNDYQIIRNQLDQALMEAKTLIIERQANKIIIYTGEINAMREFTATDITTEKVITYYKDTDGTGSLYISNTYDTHMAPGNLITDIVNDFDIDVTHNIKSETVDGVISYYCVNPLSANITLSLNHKKSEIASDYTINLRNRIKEMFLYQSSSDLVGLNDSSVTVYEYKVK